MIDFYGTVYNDNITILGLNLIYHYMLTGDPYARIIMDDAMRLDPAALPEREIVPINVSYARDKITIESDYDNVNTTIAYHDMFTSDQPIESRYHLTRVQKGWTEIQMHYPYFREGFVLSLVGLLLAGTHLVIVSLRYHENRKGKTNAAAESG